MNYFTVFVCSIVVAKTEPIGRQELQKLPPTRRIIAGKPVGETRPYMVYLRPASQAEPQFKEIKWMCGGVIIHERYILTSAACIEDAKNFYVVSGTNKWIPAHEENECIKYGAKKAVWKCVPKDYFFDGEQFDNIRWMANDIAVVKVEDDFNFNKRVRGCDYIPKKIVFNNVTDDSHLSGTMASIAGWGSSSAFGDVDIARTSDNSQELLESEVRIISNKNCKKRWDPLYHHIIDQSMICTKDDQDGTQMSQACLESGIKCKELDYSEEYDDNTPPKMRIRRVMDPNELEVHGAWHHHANNTRRTKTPSGGFCENDHGGPLITGYGATSMVIGIISACMTKDVTKKCYGPYLYTSVWKNRALISCAIDKDIRNSRQGSRYIFELDYYQANFPSTATCRRSLKTSQNQIYEVSFDWKDHPKGTGKL